METIKSNPAFDTEEKYELNGFCPYSVSQGILMPGNLNFGTKEWKSRTYTFALKETLLIFDQDPDKYIERVIDVARKKPELIVFLDIFDEVHKSRQSHQMKLRPSAQQVTVQSEGVQTELHPIPTNLDRNYTSNVWELRRRAIHLTNLRRCQTKSAQTTMTYQSYEVTTQTYPNKEKSSQTKKDASTSNDAATTEMSSSACFDVVGKNKIKKGK